MKILLAAVLLFGCKSSDKSEKQPPPQPHVKAKAANMAPLVLEVAIDGVVSKWESDAFAKVPKLSGTNNGGEERDLYGLRELAHTLVGPNARVVSVRGSDAKSKPVELADWTDTSKTPVLQVTRRGTFKYRWTDTSGKWGEPEIKDVDHLDIVNQ